MKIVWRYVRLQSVANFRAHVLSRTSISPSLGQQFQWIRGQWQRPFPSPRDRVAPPTATPRRRRQSLPSKLVKAVDDGLTSRHRAIMLRTSIQQRLPASRPTGTAVRFDDVTKRSPPTTVQQPKSVPEPAYQQPVLAHQRPGAVRQEIGVAHQPLGPAYKPPSVVTPVLAQQTESPAYHSGDSAYQPPGLAHPSAGVARQRPVVACRPQQPYPGEMGHTAAISGTNMSIKSQESKYPEEDEAWSTGVVYAPAYSRTMAAPMSRNEATMSFTKKPQTRGPSAPASQLQIPPPYSSDDRSLGGTVSASPRPPASPQQSPRPIEPAGAGPMGGASSALPRPPTTHQPSPRSAEPAGAGPAVRREVVRQKKMAVMEKADSVDEDEFDKLVAINYQQLVDVPPSPTGTATLSPPVSRDPQRSPKLSPRLARRPSPAEQSPPISAAPPSLRAPPLRQTHQKLQQKTAGNKQDLKTEEESEDELSK